ncbi:alpha/beta hydrolase [Thiohalorhabdus sp. Cl-TMA]|uniref:Alpha/beta hydrolase n=1 Tax=Thiohalorhabdus methylotrophus TaxID=3242694 RepID=A0ABV4TW99_9GAMM
MQEPSETPLEHLDLAPEQGPARAAVIWLHGLGADGHDFAPLFRGIGNRLPGVRVLLPHAPEQPVTINGGMRMRAWYDVVNPDLTVEPDLAGIHRSARAVERLVEMLESAGIPAERTVIGGFSQGALVALWTGLGLSRSLAGIAGLSGYLPAEPPLAEVQKETPIFLGHGRHDGIVPFPEGEAARDRLRALGCREPVWHPYSIDHGVNADEADDLLAWVGAVLRGQ